jgi:hypothetical protein
MATRSFPIQVLRLEIDAMLDRTLANMRVITAMDSQTMHKIMNVVGPRARIPMEGTRRAYDALDRVNQAHTNVVGISALILIHKGATEVELDSQDAIELTILDAFNDVVERHQSEVAKLPA